MGHRGGEATEGWTYKQCWYLVMDILSAGVFGVVDIQWRRSSGNYCSYRLFIARATKIGGNRFGMRAIIVLRQGGETEQNSQARPCNGQQRGRLVIHHFHLTSILRFLKAPYPTLCVQASCPIFRAIISNKYVFHFSSLRCNFSSSSAATLRTSNISPIPFVVEGLLKNASRPKC